MQDQQPSIFDQDFLQETYIRRRELMPLALKILVWFFLVTSAFSFINVIYSFLQYQLPVLEGIPGIIIPSTLLPSLTLSLLNVLANLFLLLEKKWAVLLALIATLLSLVSWGFAIYKLVSARLGDPTITVLTLVFFMSLKLPYVLMLLRIKRDWETKAVAGK